MDPMEVLDYCCNGCEPSDSITAWDGDTCLCCGGTWGEPPSGRAEDCRKQHVEGQVWIDLLEDEQTPMAVSVDL